MGRLAGIARHPRPKAVMEVIESARVTFAGGIEGDHRGAMKGKPYKRQVTLMEAEDWARAMAEVQRNLSWEDRRANLLVEGIDLPQRLGARIRVGEVVFEVMAETEPCERMEALAEGLRAALTPDWRGGVCTRVVAEGRIAVGDDISIEEA